MCQKVDTDTIDYWQPYHFIYTTDIDHLRLVNWSCTIVASKIKGTAREIYHQYIFLQWEFSLYTHRVGIQGKSLQVKPLKDLTPHSKQY